MKKNVHARRRKVACWSNLIYRSQTLHNKLIYFIETRFCVPHILIRISNISFAIFMEKYFPIFSFRTSNNNFPSWRDYIVPRKDSNPLISLCELGSCNPDHFNLSSVFAKSPARSADEENKEDGGGGGGRGGTAKREGEDASLASSSDSGQRHYPSSIWIFKFRNND